MAISDITVNGNTYTDADWRANWEGTISAIANDIAAAIAGAALVGGTLNKAISGNTTLTVNESLNRVYVFTGTLSANANITFQSFEGLALVSNETTGGFNLACGNGGAGTTASIGPAQISIIYSDGTDMALAVGVQTTSTGSAVAGTFSASGAVSVGGNLTVTGGMTLGTDLSADGDLSFNGDALIGGGLNVGGITAFQDDVIAAGDFTLTTGTFSAAAIVGNAMTISGTTGRIFSAATLLGEIRGALSAPSGTACWWQVETAATQMWLFGKDADAQSGSNSGANFSIVACSDAGTPLGTAFKIYRDTMEVNLPELPTSSAGLRAGSLWNDAGTLKVA